METVFGRYKNLIILVGVLFLQVLGLALQVKHSDSDNTRLIRVWAVDAISPFERVLVSVQNGVGNLWHNYFYLRGVRAENRELKEQIEQMRLEQVRLNQDAEQAHRLQALLAFKEQTVDKTVAAQVIGSSGSDLSRIVYIDKGEDDGLKPDMAVITADGVVGKILMASSSVSQVLLINDQTSGVGVILEKSRLQGVLRGTTNGEVVLEQVMSDEQVTPGEKVLTSGGDQIFPKGMPVGTVSKVSPGKDLFLNIAVKPAADLNRLEEVLVVTQKREMPAVAQDSGRMRASDILAERLPSVPEKSASGANPPAATGTNSTVPAATVKAVPTANGSLGVKSPASASPEVVAGSTARTENPREAATGAAPNPSSAHPPAGQSGISSPSGSLTVAPKPVVRKTTASGAGANVTPVSSQNAAGQTKVPQLVPSSAKPSLAGQAQTPPPAPKGKNPAASQPSSPAAAQPTASPSAGARQSGPPSQDGPH